MTKTVGGRHVYATGNNPDAARLAGVRTRRVLLAVYATAGLLYAIAGDPQAGQSANLDSITAVVVGGTSLFGGRGSVLGTLIGTLIVGIFRNGLSAADGRGRHLPVPHYRRPRHPGGGG